ncbi:constitutive coactivator of PPAR-gamma-like protein 1 homolog isoform X2 [Biomphalaria glabrata]|uniref:Constitutive coactivator of PPAR-gamma-like protein 1 homolog isoform X2 n=1 Tax=Biomphalaria glabrata TaxID=6526 RepID=A0A9W3A2T3_BIOGL|nr:constitutive coactivator of PPAR-gamma-like protein 1 homolog isoform X2 [Biomphalaria glabrata]
MGIKDFQEFLETECSSACVSVDLLKISRAFVPKRRPIARVGQVGTSGRFCVVVDAESCLDRLYGGYFSDWVCGGQWNRMTSFLGNLVQACHSANMELVVFFNGALENQKINEWMSQQLTQRDKVRYVLRHIANKGTPPPKVWWNQPVFLKEALKMALRQLGVTIACSMDDHHQEVIKFCREHNLQGIIAQESIYTIFDPPRYFSSNNLKLTYKGSLETKEYIMDEIAKCMNLNPNRFCIFAALLGNHILTDEDLMTFRELMPTTDTGKPRRNRDKLDADLIKATCDYVRNLPAVDNLDIVGNDVFKLFKANKADLVERFKQSVQYFVSGTHEGFMKNCQLQRGLNYGNPLMGPNINQVPRNIDARVLGNAMGDAQSKKNLGFPQVPNEILRVAVDRHQKGLMHPHIYQVLTQGEVKLPVILEDDTTRELPSYIDLYRPLRQAIYSVLLNLNKQKIVHEIQNKEKVNVMQPDFSAQVKEWVVRRGSGRPTYEVVTARPVEWKTPSIQRMWLGQQDGDKDRRLRAFLTIMMSDTSLMLNTNYVPQHLLVMCSVLRYIMQYGRILQRQELDAFLAMSVSPLLHDVQTMQDLKLPNIVPRGSQLASLFMSGIETAAMANDVCGAPIPWTMICPWLYMDGKLFHFKLLKANNNTPLIDICDGQMEQVLRVERMRQAILENLRVDFAKPLLPGFYYPYPGQPYSANPLPYGPTVAARGRGNPMPGIPSRQVGRGRGILGRSPIEAQGGQLEIAGVVVGQWGPNMSNRRGGRGGNQIPTQVMSVGQRGRGIFTGRGGFLPGREGMIRGRIASPLYNSRGAYRPAYYSRGRGSPTKRPVRIVARPGRGRTVKATPKGRGVTVDVSSTMRSKASDEFDEVDEEVNGGYSGASDEDEEIGTATVSIKG